MDDQASPTEEMDGRLSDLPEHVLLLILSFLSTKLAARTSLLSRRFRHLWEASPYVDLDISCLTSSNLVDLANRIIMHRNPPSPLHRLCLRLKNTVRFDKNLLTASYISSLLVKAGSLGLCHLTVDLAYDMLPILLPLILSLHSLEFLSIIATPDPTDCSPDIITRLLNLSLTRVGSAPFDPLLSSPITLTRLASLSIETDCLHYDLLNHLLLQLNALRELHLKWIGCVDRVDLKTVTVKTLKLFLDCRHLIISTPSLELFEFISGLLGNFHWEMPLLKKAVIQMRLVTVESVPAICNMLNAVSHVEELHLDIQECLVQIYPFHALLVPDIDPPIFFALKHFHLEICFYDYNIQDLVTLLQLSPALETLRLVHKPPVHVGIRRFRKKKSWKSKLPQNAEGNNEHAYFKNLLIEERRNDLLEQLTRRRGRSSPNS